MPTNEKAVGWPIFCKEVNEADDLSGIFEKIDVSLDFCPRYVDDSAQ